MTKKAVYRTFIFFLSLYLLDFTIGSVLSHLYKNQVSTIDESLNHTIYNSNEDILIFGNSRVLYHFDPRIFADSLKLTCYNAGRSGGYTILFSAALISAVYQRYSPKIIIVEFEPLQMAYSDDDYENLSTLLPYYNVNTYIQNIVNLRKPFEKFKLLSKIYPYNSRIISIIRYNLNKKSKNNLINGYIEKVPGLYKTSAEDEKYDEYFGNAIDTNKVNALNYIINICKANNTKLYFVNSPMYQGYSADKQVKSIASQNAVNIIKSNKLIFINYANDTAYTNHKELFNENLHLNTIGAKKFSSGMARVIKNSNS